VYVYILECEDGSYYTGIAKDLEKRLTNHGRGSKYTRAKKPIKLIYVEQPENAYKREPQIKKLSRQEKKGLINSHLNEVALFKDIEVS
jgi:putative endonuclease